MPVAWGHCSGSSVRLLPLRGYPSYSCWRIPQAERLAGPSPSPDTRVAGWPEQLIFFPFLDPVSFLHCSFHNCSSFSFPLWILFCCSIHFAYALGQQCFYIWCSLHRMPHCLSLRGIKYVPSALANVKIVNSEAQELSLVRERKSCM